MDIVHKFISEKTFNTIREDGGEHYFLTGFSSQILLNVKVRLQELIQDSGDEWKVLLICPPELNNDFLSKQLPKEYLQEACSPDYAASFRDNNKVIYIYPNLISQIISETINLNTSVNLSILGISPESCLSEQLKDYLKNKNHKEENIKLLIEFTRMTMPDVNEEYEFEEFYKGVMGVVNQSHDIRGLLEACRKVFGFLPDQKLEDFEAFNSRNSKQIMKLAEDNLDEYFQFLGQICSNKYECLKKYAAFDPKRAEIMKQFIDRKDISDLIPEKKSYRAKRKIIEDWPKELDVNFLRLEADSDLRLSSIEFENHLGIFHDKYWLCNSSTFVKFAVRGSDESAKNEKEGTITINVNGNEYDVVQISIDEIYRIDFGQINERSILRKCTCYPQNEKLDSQLQHSSNNILINLANSKYENQEEFLFVEENKNILIIEIEPDKVLMLDMNEWKDKSVEVEVSEITPVSWMNCSKTLVSKINDQEEGENVHLSQSFVIECPEGGVIRIDREEVSNGETSSKKGRSLSADSIFESKIKYIELIRADIKDIENQNIIFKVRKSSKSFRLQAEGFASQKFVSRKNLGQSKYKYWTDQIFTNFERTKGKSLLPLGCLSSDKKLVNIRPMEIDWEVCEIQFKEIDGFADFLENRKIYFEALNKHLRGYLSTNTSVRFCNFLEIEKEVVSYAQSYIKLLEAALRFTDDEYKSFLGLFFSMDSIIEFGIVKSFSNKIFKPEIQELLHAKYYLGPFHPIKALFCLNKSSYFENIFQKIVNDNKTVGWKNSEEIVNGLGFPQFIILPDTTKKLQPFINIATDDWGGWGKYVWNKNVFEAMSDESTTTESVSGSSLTSNEISYAIGKLEFAHPYTDFCRISLPNGGGGAHLLNALENYNLQRKPAIKNFEILFNKKSTKIKNAFSLLPKGKRSNLPRNLKVRYYEGDAKTDEGLSHILFSNAPKRNIEYGEYSIRTNNALNCILDGCTTWEISQLSMHSADSGGIQSARINFAMKSNESKNIDLVLIAMHLLNRIALNPEENKSINLDDRLRYKTTEITLDPAYLASFEHEHDMSNWVFSSDQNMDVEYFDLSDKPYVVDYNPQAEALVVTSKDKGGIIRNFIRRGLEDSGINSEKITEGEIDLIFKQLNKFTGRSLIRILNNFSEKKGVIGLGLARYYLEKKGLLDVKDTGDQFSEVSFLISIDDNVKVWRNMYLDIFGLGVDSKVNDAITKKRADLLLVKISRKNGEFLFNFQVIEVKNREDLNSAEWSNQVKASYEMFSSLFGNENSDKRADQELVALKFAELFDIHLRRRFRQKYQTDNDKIKQAELFRLEFASSFINGNFVFEKESEGSLCGGSILHFDAECEEKSSKLDVLHDGKSLVYSKINISDLLEASKKEDITEKNIEDVKLSKGVPDELNKEKELVIEDKAADLPLSEREMVTDQNKNIDIEKSEEEIKGIKEDREIKPDMSSDLENIVKKVKDVLIKSDIDVSFGESKVTPNAYRILIKGDYGLDKKKFEKLKDTFLTVAELELGQIETVRGYYALSFKRQDRGIVDYFECAECRDRSVGFGNTKILLGQNEATGQLAYIDLGSDPHCLIGGQTNSGKSFLLFVIIFDLIFTNSPSELELILIDPKKVEFQHFNAVPHVREIITEQAQAISQLEELVIEMDHRYDLLREQSVNNIIDYNGVIVDDHKKMKRKIMIFDEFADWMYDEDFKSRTTAAVNRLSAKARAAGIHLIIATQRPSNEVLPMILRANLGIKIALKVDREQNSKIILDDGGAENLYGYGHMIVIAGGEKYLAQGALIKPSEMPQLVEKIKNKYSSDIV